METPFVTQITDRVEMIRLLTDQVRNDLRWVDQELFLLDSRLQRTDKLSAVRLHSIRSRLAGALIKLGK